MATTPSGSEYDVEFERHSPVSLDSELSPENRGVRLALAIGLNLVAFLALAFVIYLAVVRRW